MSRFKTAVGEDVNNASDRAAMGYPDAFVCGNYDDLSECYSSLKGKAAIELVHLLQDSNELLCMRLAAGQLLALNGDPRIDHVEPAMVDIAGGEVIVGLKQDDLNNVVEQLQDTGVLKEWIAKECPQFSTSVSSYRLAKYPVTNYEFRKFLVDTGYSKLPTSWTFGRYPQERSNHPVFTVSAETASRYVLWLANLTGRNFRLPSEVEWEYGAAGPEGLEYPWGNSFSPANANTVETGLLSTSAIGSFPSGDSPFGISDMAGNVEEFVADEYSPYPDAQPVEDDLSRLSPRYRVARGGSFTRYRDLTRCKRRHGYYPKEIYVMGFRLAESI